MTQERSGYLLVRVGSRRVGLQLRDVLEVVALGEVHPVPAVEPAVRGVIAVQGRMVPLVHLGALLDGIYQAPLPGDVGVMVEVEGRRLCLEVQEAELLMREPALPVPPGEAMPWAVGVARHSDGIVPLLDLAALSSRLTEAAWT
jgi:chemotaxis signal transduction protein